MKYEYEFTPRFSDFDRLNMVHHSVYLKYIEEARIDAFEEMFQNNMQKFLDEVCNIVVSEIHIKYLNIMSERVKYKVVLDIDYSSCVYIIFHFKITDYKHTTYSKGKVKICFVDRSGKLMLEYPETIRKYIDSNEENKSI